MPSPEPKPELIEVMLLGSSITRLERAGSADRERDYYGRLGKHFNIRIFGYENGAKGGSLLELPVISSNKWIQSLFAPFSLRGEGTGIIRTKQFWGCWSGWLLSKLSKRRLVIRCGYIWSRAARHQNPRWPKFLHIAMVFFESLLIRLGDGFIFATEEIAEHYGQMIGKKPRLIVPNGFDLETFKPRMEVKPDHDYAYVGRLIPLKGIGALLESLPPGSRLLVIGRGELEGMVRSHPQATFMGMVPNYMIPSELARARCFVSMSHTEGNPKCLYEAVLCGLYPILSGIPAHRNLVAELGYGTILTSGESLPNTGFLAIDADKLTNFRARYGFEGVIDREAVFCKNLIRTGV